MPANDASNCSEIAIPKTARDFTAQWFNAALAPYLNGAQVLGVKATPFAEPGQTADIVEIWLDYDSADCPLPDRMIAKLAATDPTTLELCKVFGQYEKEVSFYQNFASGDLPIPRCFHAQFEPETFDTVILLEHLAPSYSPGYAISVEQVGIALREVATIHARWWNDNEVKQSPAMVQLDDMERWENVATSTCEAINTVRGFVGSRCEETIEVVTLYQTRLKEITQFWQTRPFTLSHSDFHGKQMFFPNEAGEGKFALIDFQYPLAGPGVFDVSRLLNLGLSSDARMASQTGLIEDYLAALAANGVQDYGYDDFLIDHRLGTMFTQLINVIAVAQTDHELIAEECAQHGLDWEDVWLLRGEAMLRELKVADFLRAI
ncbi:MAG: phosphotransferase [Erythrobacter sp.]